MLADKSVTSEKLAPGLDVSGLFFILPEGTQFPYTLTEEDKTKLANARLLILTSPSGSLLCLQHPAANTYVGVWYGIANPTSFTTCVVSETEITAPSTAGVIQSDAVRFKVPQTLTAEQKTRARTNIGAAEDPNTSGDPQATLEEPPIVDEEPIP